MTLDSWYQKTEKLAYCLLKHSFAMNTHICVLRHLDGSLSCDRQYTTRLSIFLYP